MSADMEANNQTYSVPDYICNKCEHGTENGSDCRRNYKIKQIESFKHISYVWSISLGDIFTIVKIPEYFI